MAENKPRLGAGDVKIVLQNSQGEPEDLVLKPTYHAARTLSAQTGGLMKALQSVADLNTEMVVTVVALGLGYGRQGRPPPSDLPERVWNTGLSDDTGGLASQCIVYIRALMSGGQLPKEAAGSDSATPDPSQG